MTILKETPTREERQQDQEAQKMNRKHGPGNWGWMDGRPVPVGPPRQPTSRVQKLFRKSNILLRQFEPLRNLSDLPCSPPKSVEE